jgi:PAS domain-containing protein
MHESVIAASMEGDWKSLQEEMPYGYLTKPFQSGELKATLLVALHRAKVDARQDAAHRKLAATMSGMREGVLMVSTEGRVEFMNAAAEGLASRALHEVLKLNDCSQRAADLLSSSEDANTAEEFGWTLRQLDGGSVRVDLSLAPLAGVSGPRKGYVIYVRDAAQRMRSQAIEETLDEAHSFDQSPTAMVQLDGDGRIVRVNQALQRESGVAADSLVGRSLTGLSLDPDPRIAKDLMHTLLQGGTFMGTARPHSVN